tara:strand:- start:270 stop:869 length:600 start_codon:yes stop_codon:yes gene_type:complete
MYAQGASLLTEMGNKYKDNESLTGFVSGTFADAGRTMMMGGLSLGYNKAMSAHLAQLNQGMENLKTGNQLKLMGAEGRITQQLIGAQGMQQRLGIRETGRQQRAGYREQGKQERMNIGALGTQERLNIGARGVEQRLGLQTAGQQERLNIGARGREQRLGIQTAGQEERKNIGKRYSEERNMRADARGAIRSLGARFFG